MKRDITELVEFQNNDDEYLPLTKCACGAKFKPWEFALGIYEDMPKTCPECGRRMIFSISIRVYEVGE